MKSLKLKCSVEQNVFFTADSHFYHNRDFVWKARGYSSLYNHTDKVLEKINELVKYSDVMFHLGDFALNTSSEQFESLLSRINCQWVYYINGNHNSRIQDVYRKTILEQFGKDDINVYPIKYRNIIFVGDYLEVEIDKQTIILSHYPLYSWNHMNHGAWHCFGHIHSEKDVSVGKSIDVGWDQHKKPVSFQELKQIMDKKSIKSEGHH